MWTQMGKEMCKIFIFRHILMNGNLKDIEFQTLEAFMLD